MPTFRIISLGCSRNLVDSELIAGSLKKAGYSPASGKSSDLCIINTCAFIQQARDESVDAILEAGALKENGEIKHIAICGCLPQLYKEKLKYELPEADIILGTSDYPALPHILAGLSGGRQFKVSRRPNYLYTERSPRLLLTPRHYAYVKIAEGCSNDCSYCIISRLKGPFRSRPVSSVVNEVKTLSAAGNLREVNLIGQDTTRYGYDLYGKFKLAGLLKKLAGLHSRIGWIRILYTHPAHYTEDLINTVRDEDKVCKYLDLPVQHSSDKILRLMHRCTTKKDIITLIDRIRSRIPGVILRTSIIVGFPGETDKDFKEVLKFIKDIAFDRLGAFIYSREDMTRAARMRGQVPEKLKEARLDELMRTQQAISMEKNKRYIGKTLKVLVDEKESGCADKFIGRTQGDAPEVDGNVIISGAGVKIGEFCAVKITGAMEYDLIGEAAG